MEKVSNIFSKVGRVLLSLVEAIVILYVIGVTSIILFRNKFGYTQYGNVTLVTVNEVNHHYLQDSDIGTLLTIKNQGQIEKGDLIYYYDVRDEAYVVKNGVVKDYIRGEDSSIYTLEGEGNVSVASTKVIGKYVNKKKNIGSIIDILVSRFGFLLLVLLPIMIIFIYQIYEFFIVYKYGKLEIEKEDNVDSKNDALVDKKETVVEKKEIVENEKSNDKEANSIVKEDAVENSINDSKDDEVETINTVSAENNTSINKVSDNKGTEAPTLEELKSVANDANTKETKSDDIELL